MRQPIATIRVLSWIVYRRFYAAFALSLLSVLQETYAILREAVSPLTLQTHLHKGIRIVDGAVRIGDDTVQAHICIHVTFPALIRGAFEDFDFLAAMKNHMFHPDFHFNALMH